MAPFFAFPSQLAPALFLWLRAKQGILCWGSNISHLGKRNIIFKHALGGDMFFEGSLEQRPVCAQKYDRVYLESLPNAAGCTFPDCDQTP